MFSHLLPLLVLVADAPSPTPCAVNVINLSEAEARMSSVERVVEYTDLPKERPLVIEDQKPPPSYACGVEETSRCRRGRVLSL